MKEQESIFDDMITDDLTVRRRDLLSPMVKIYMWLGMIMGGLLILSAIGMLIDEFFNVSHRESDSNKLVYTAVFTIIIMTPGILLFLMTFLLWKEVKWAIKFNWIVAGICCIIVAFNLQIDRLETLFLFLPVGIMLPYWFSLNSIQKKWEEASPL